MSYGWRASGGKQQLPNAQQQPVAQQQPQQPSQSKAPDMSAYMPQGARANDLTAPNLPYNMWGAAAFNSANNGMNNGQGNYTSFTLPGYGQKFDGATGQARSEPFQSWDGNMAYAQPSQRPGPISWTTTGPDGQQREGMQGFQQAAMQRDATAQGIINRLGAYQTGGLTGAPSFDMAGLLQAGEQSLQNNTWRNPFMDPMAYNTLPSLTKPSYDPTPAAWASPPPNQFAAPVKYAQPAEAEYSPPSRMGAAQPIEPQSQGEPYPSAPTKPVYDEPAPEDPYGDPEAKPKKRPSRRAPWRAR